MRHHSTLWFIIVALVIALFLTIGKVRKLEVRIDTLQTTVTTLETTVEAHQNWIEWSYGNIHGNGDIKTPKPKMWGQEYLKPHNESGVSMDSSQVLQGH